MSSTSTSTSTPSGNVRDRLTPSGQTPDQARFELLFARSPSAAELERFRATHQALMIGLPARVRRAAGRVITRL